MRHAARGKVTNPFASHSGWCFIGRGHVPQPPRISIRKARGFPTVGASS
ncbi:hypothetical protein ASAP_1362 [Asaia bogorensis]|uniref:Uncharacterized protein n=1 Tax=Asaia bogorensis TaxID=91915 RepID=A0A060QKF1_9PROT|nr:hypothetical protein ASAP_1362 [Asaia bogorensis]